jgi:hypothetical protein
MKELISERPNVIPVGLGNNNSEIDMSALTSGYNSELEFENALEDEDGVDVDDENETDDSNEISIPKKRAASALERKRAPRPRKSEEANPGQSTSKKGKVVDRFVEAVKAEEITNQKHLDLRKIRVEGETQANIAKIKAKAEVQMQRERLKAEARLEEKRQAHELRMAQLRLPHNLLGVVPHRNHASSSATPSTGYESYENSPLPNLPMEFDQFNPLLMPPLPPAP